MELKNGIEKMYSRFFGKEKNHESVIVGVEETPTTPPHPLFTFFNIGPDFLTYSYPVDAKLYREIYDESGLIGPSAYKDSPKALEAMRENDNTWFTEIEHQPESQLLKNDLLCLARQYGKIGAYSLLGSIQAVVSEKQKYWKLGAELGEANSMADYGISLYLSGKVEDGFMWLKRSADTECSLAQFMVAISYQFGTLSEMDITKAAEYYLKINDDLYLFHKFLNLGVMLVENGYYHTALSMFQKMRHSAKGKEEELGEYRDVENYLSNVDSCQRLLELPYAEREKRVVIQWHSRRLSSIFCRGQKSPDPIIPEVADIPIEKWTPTPEQIEIDPRDIEERKQLPIWQKRAANKYEDYLFLSIPVKIKDPTIVGNQRELVFLEKNCHAELNKYIQNHLTHLRASLKAIGFFLKYLPSHMEDMVDRQDQIGSFHNDHGSRVWTDIGILFQKHTEREYWQSLIPSRTLPEDCAGFLHFVPNMRNLEDCTNYEYILFPYRSGTDWPRAFAEFISYMRRKTIIPIYDTPDPIALLPTGSYLHISEDFEFRFMDNAGTLLADIKMPTLSKVLYMLLLNHPEGIVLKDMIDHHAELLSLYQKMAGSKAKEENIDTLCDPTNNSASEKLSRIKSAFTQALEKQYKDDLPAFLPQGKRGEAIVVSVERGRVKMK